jgi:GTPase SAR1 family protein
LLLLSELNKNMTNELVIHVVGNKIDLEAQRKVSLSTVEDYCDGIQHYVSGIHEVSAKDNYGKFAVVMSRVEVEACNLSIFLSLCLNMK